MRKYFIVFVFLALWLFPNSSSAACKPSGNGTDCSIWWWANKQCDNNGSLYCCADAPQCQDFQSSPYRDSSQWQQVDCKDPTANQAGLVIWFTEDVTGNCYMPTANNNISPQQLLNIPGGQQAQGDDENPLCDGGLGVNTAIGCLSAGRPTVFIGQLLGWAIVVGGGIAFLLAAYAGFQISTAAGDPKRVQAARELLTSALSGLLLIIFSIALLKVIGINILSLSTFGLRP